jgi:hypothetical protein
MAVKHEFIDLIHSEWKNGLNPPSIARKQKVRLHKVYYALKKLGIYPKNNSYGTLG